MRFPKTLFLIPPAFFLLGLVNIHLSLLGLFCMAPPFVLLLAAKEKVWCKGPCPRAVFLGKVKDGSLTKRRPAPKFFLRWDLKWMLLAYFLMNLLFIVLSTLRVALGWMEPLEILRFFMVFSLPGPLPQLLSIPGAAPWLTHLSYRIYSMMLTTTALGLAAALFYRPRAWCLICPVGTLSDEYLKRIRKDP